VVIRRKKQKHCLPEELESGDGWVALSLARAERIDICARVGKHTDELAIELVISTEGKTDCKEWHTDAWEGYERVLPDEVEHYISKRLTQRKRTNQWDCASANALVGIADKTNSARYGSKLR
jgi:insertion element IS1 protein InsB